MGEQDAQRQPARPARPARARPRRTTTSTTATAATPTTCAAATAHESLFNVADGTYRCPSTQQGYSPFTTWTRGLAWAMLGFAEQLEFLATVPRRGARAVRRPRRGRDAAARAPRARPAITTSTIAAADGVPYWDDRRARPRGAATTGATGRRSVQRSRAGRQLRRRHRGAGAAAARPSARPRAASRGRGPLPAGRPARRWTRCFDASRT